MCFGLRSAPSSFCRLLSIIFAGLEGVIVYLDDILVFATDLAKLLELLREVMRRLKAANLKLQPKKCEFMKREIKYLGHVITKDGVKPDPDKVKEVQNFPVPKNPKQFKSYLGISSYYHRHIKNYAHIAKPLTTLLKKDQKFVWTDSANEAFEKLKDKLCNSPILQRPRFDQPFIASTDASSVALGGILSQGKLGEDLPVAYASRTLTPAETRYTVMELEALGALFCIEQFRPYLYGHKFTLVTDHRALLFLKSKKDPNSRLARWRLKLAEYEYDVIYRKGTPTCQPMDCHALKY